MHLNIRCIRKKFEFVKETLNDINILYFTEVHLHNEDLFKDGLKNVPFRKDVSPHSSRLQKIDLEANLNESLRIEIKQKGESIVLCNIYRPPGIPVLFGII